MADKRIYQLQEDDPVLNAFLAFDLLGYTEAKKVSVQNLLDFLQENVAVNISFNTGSTNPDNTIGEDGSIYIKIGSNRLDFYQKEAGAYELKGTFETSGGGGSSALTFTLNVDIDGFVDLSGQTGMPVSGTMPSAIRAYSEDVDYSQSVSYTPSTQVLYTGLEENTEVTIKITF